MSGTQWGIIGVAEWNVGRACSLFGLRHYTWNDSLLRRNRVSPQRINIRLSLNHHLLPFNTKHNSYLILSNQQDYHLRLAI